MIYLEEKLKYNAIESAPSSILPMNVNGALSNQKLMIANCIFPLDQ